MPSAYVSQVIRVDIINQIVFKRRPMTGICLHAISRHKSDARIAFRRKINRETLTYFIKRHVTQQVIAIPLSLVTIPDHAP